jgi:eukaryotic-like serine/threonine-protein kinase
MEPGTQLGHYTVLAALGKGGMGEVWRARDTKLGREVAIKTLPREFAEDPGRLARFGREAKLLASLNHPNIAIIHGFEEDKGKHFLVLELVEGETLADRLERGAISVEESLKLAVQIAAALEAAHEKGVVHRDLKPANIKLTAGGKVKVLDFGLAKAFETESAETNLSNSPTLSMAATQAGVILGTAAYMAPEQAKGEHVDRRADIWAFGVVLYEMLAGERLFKGEDIPEILAAVLKEEPRLDGMPAKVRPLLRRCLEKDPRKRLRDIGDMGLLLEEGDLQPARSSNPAARWIWPGVATLFAVIAVGLAFIHFRETPPETPLRITSLLPTEGSTYDFRSTVALPALSPDGKKIVFGARANDGKGPEQLWVRKLDSAKAQPLPGTEGGHLPFWSPDGRYVGFGSSDRKLKKIDVQGGPPVWLTDLPNDFRGGSWSPEGVIVFGINSNGPVMRISSTGGTASPVTALDSEKESIGNRFPWFLPDGKHFLYISPANTGPNAARVGSLDDFQKPGKVVAEVESHVVYAQGHLLYLRGGTLMAQPFDVNRLETTGEAVPVAENIPVYMNPSRPAGFTVSANGLLAYHAGGSGSQVQLTWVDRNGKQLATVGDPVQGFSDIELSPDQKTLVGSVIQGVQADLWTWDLASGLSTRFTFEGVNPDAVWSPDGSTIVYRSTRNGKTALFRRPANGTGVEELLYADANNNWATSWSPDSKVLLYSNIKGGSYDISALPLTPEKPGGPLKPQALLQTPFNERSPQFSPDGKWIAYASSDFGQYEIFVVPYPGPGGKRQVSSGGGLYPRWQHDGHELFYVGTVGSGNGGNLMAAEWSVRNGSFEVGQVKKLFGGVGTGRGYLFDVSLDGQKFILPQEASPEGSNAPPPAPPLTLIENWLKLIKQ